ncbi:hypothetical protein [Usitatibacter palustris]|uniref:Lipoprotein n=1 Tax=Usitatibacter palustris TaxID=2732487 RepID=A0A6M4H7U1_9PROT|nr:hypothetical protein [Usitatibacter palustris]QJR14763.1 hypothetical protein DSM104440_01573 [Usitatibacter palustris]
MKIASLVFVSILFLGGCSSMRLVSNDDEVIDNGTTEFAETFNPVEAAMPVTTTIVVAAAMTMAYDLRTYYSCQAKDGSTRFCVAVTRVSPPVCDDIGDMTIREWRPDACDLCPETKGMTRMATSARTETDCPRPTL